MKKIVISGIFLEKKVSWPIVSQPNIHNIPIDRPTDHWRLSLSFCFLLRIERFHSHGGQGRLGLGLSHAIIITMST